MNPGQVCRKAFLSSFYKVKSIVELCHYNLIFIKLVLTSDIPIQTKLILTLSKNNNETRV